MCREYSKDSKIAGILLAAGSSSRMGSKDKLWLELNNKPVIEYSLEVLLNLDIVDVLVVVSPKERQLQIKKLLANQKETIFVEGGERRQDSVAAGLTAVPDADWYIIHDGARPFISDEIILRVFEAAKLSGAAVPGLRLNETVKKADGAGRVIETLDRSILRTIQTPQIFRGELIRNAHNDIDEDVTDDAMMIELLGGIVEIVEGDAKNIKLTNPIDFQIAINLLDLDFDIGKDRYY
ncbi:MAG: 2-C-methyl-D-erythritol 4-phosphate cytidylyltransferase [Dehalococcoidia bacterium]|nr:2-C-methyl-D-erythritol 4-phosphate cytidylyltransferase [Dehalococcoidia bacterium]